MTKSKTDGNQIHLLLVDQKLIKTEIERAERPEWNIAAAAEFIKLNALSIWEFLFLRNGGRVSLTKKNLQKNELFCCIAKEKKNQWKYVSQKIKTYKKMSFSCVSLLLQQLRKKTDIRRNNKSLFKL